MESKIFKQSRRRYDASFKQDVLKMIESGRSVTDVARALGITSSLVYRWVKLTEYLRLQSNLIQGLRFLIPRR